jgi:predicted enzyme related to lactoylglutathione lyase
MNRVVHFEIHADDPGRARAFYQALFGWRFDQFGEMDYWLIYTGPKDQPGINGGLHKRLHADDGAAVIGYVCTVDVKDLDAAVKQVRMLGGSCLVPRKAIPEVGWFSYCKDTEGNIFGLIQNDKKAA